MRFVTLPIITTITILGLSLNLGGCEYRSRYPCQDPSNWNKAECNNIECKVHGSCTEDLLGPKFFRKEDLPIIGSDQTESNESVDSNSDENSCSAACERSAHKKVIYKPEPTKEPANESFETEVVEQEQPLTMNTIVDTAAHNAAAR